MSDNDPTAASDEEIVGLAQAERDAGVPDVQTAQAATDAKSRLTASDGETRVQPIRVDRPKGRDMLSAVGLDTTIANTRRRT